MAHRANRIAFALVRDQAGYDPSSWTRGGLTETLHNSGRQCQARRHEGPGPDAAAAMADTARCYAASSLAPGSFAIAAARTKPDDPSPQRGRIRQRGRPAPRQREHLPTNRPQSAPTRRSRSPTPTHRLDATYSQLDPGGSRKRNPQRRRRRSRGCSEQDVPIALSADVPGTRAPYGASRGLRPRATCTSSRRSTSWWVTGQSFLQPDGRAPPHRAGGPATTMCL